METTLQRSIGELNLPDIRESSETFTKSRNALESQQDLLGLSSSCLAPDMSHLESNVDYWIQGTSAETGVQSALPTVQRSTLTPGTSSSFNMTRVWCALALMVPVLTMQGNWALRCSPSLLFNSMELMLTNMAAAIQNARAQVSRLTRPEITRDCFATVMDVVLAIYAFGFLVLSMYRAAIVG